MNRSIVITALCVLFAAHPAEAASKKKGPARKPANQVDSVVDGDFFQDENEKTNAKPEETLDEEEIGETSKITKEIVEESEKPKPEFPYPGATEEGFEEAPRAKAKPQQPPPELTQPISISANGEYFYGFKSSAKDAAASVRLGFFAPPEITNPVNQETFESIYGENPVPTLFFDYEWMLTRSFGDLGLKVGSGIFVRQAKGKFEVENPERYGREPDEKFTFVMFPNTVSAIYRFQYHETQMFVPYIEGGGGYFTFAEIRDDGDGTKVGGAPVLMASAGMNFLIDWIDPHAIRQLDNDYGINHMWLTAEFRQIQGLNEEYDFSASVINAGIAMEF